MKKIFGEKIGGLFNKISKRCFGGGDEMERDDSHKKVGYRVSYGSGDDHDTVVARTMVPHLENIYGNKGEIFLLESPYYEKRESEAFKEYFSLKKEFSRDKGFTVELSNKEALNLFSDRKILSVEHYGAGINPVQCSGGSIFSLEGGIFLKGYSGSGQGGINEAVEKNNLLVGKTVGGAFLGKNSKTEEKVLDIVGRYIYGGPGMSHKYEDDLFYRIDGITYYVIVKEEHNMFSEKSLYHEEIREHEYPMEPTLEELEGWCKKNNLTLKKNSEDYYKEVKKEEDEKAHPKTYRTCSGEVRRYR